MRRNRLSIELGNDWAKWAVSEIQEQTAVLLESGVFPAAEAAGLLDVARRFRVQPEDIVSCVPRSALTARNLELPSTDPDEIKKIVDLQAAKQTPYPIDEIVFDYCLLEAYREGYSSILLVVAHRDMLNAHLEKLTSFGVKPQTITLATCGAAWWLSSRVSTAENETTAVLDVDDKHSDFFIRRGNRAIFTQSISIGSERLAADAESRTRLVDEVARFLQIYRSEEIAHEPAKIVLCGAAQPPALAESLTAQTAIPSEPLGLSASEMALLKNVPAESVRSLSFTSVMGMAVSAENPCINIVPPEVLIKASLMEKGHNLLVTGILCISLFLVSVAVFAETFYRKQNYLHWLESKVAATEQDAASVRSTVRRIQAVSTVNAERERLFQGLVQLHQVIPKELYLTEVNFTREHRFQMVGRAETMATVLGFVGSLKQQGVFRDVDAKRLNKRIVDNKEVVDFEIDTLLSPELPQMAQMRRLSE